VVDSGSEVKALLQDPARHVYVNDQPEDRRGRQLHVGDVVRIDGAGSGSDSERELLVTGISP
jgi:ribosome-associated protein YbcJ (S4-like RNA binding protein)